MAWYIPKEERKAMRLRAAQRRLTRQKRRNEMKIERQEKIADLIRYEFGIPIESVTPDKHLIMDFNADSLDMVELIMSIEESLKVEISDEELQTLSTVQDIYDIVEKKVAEKEGGA